MKLGCCLRLILFKLNKSVSLYNLFSSWNKEYSFGNAKVIIFIRLRKTPPGYCIVYGVRLNKKY